MARRESVNWPPSLKESGVTFTIPITIVRSPSVSRRERSCQVKCGRVAMRNSVRVLADAEKKLHVFDLGRFLVCRQAVEKNASVGFLDDPIVQQHQNAAVVQKSNHPPDPLFQCNPRRRYLIFVEGFPAVLID